MNKHALDILEHFLGGLVDPRESKLSLMGSDLITSDMIPQELKKHKVILQGIERCDEKNMPPSAENVALLSLSKDSTLIEDIQRMEHLDGAHEMVRANAIWLKDWLQQDLLAKAVEEIDKLNKMDYSDTREKQGMMLDKLLDVPIETGQQTYTRVELIDLLAEEQRKRVIRKEKWQALGPILHLEGLRNAIPILSAGDVTLITAPPKAGKTTLGMILAEINANQNDCDVLWLLLETGAKTIEERFLARELFIPSKRLRDGTVDLSKPPFLPVHERYRQEQQYHWDNDGRIYLQYVAGEKLSAIRAQIRTHKRMADIRNRPLLVIIDYLQRITKPGNKTETEALALISNYIKDMAQIYECHIVLFSQESFSTEGKQRGDSRAHGSNTPIFIAQNHIAMRVLNSTVSIYVTDGSGNIYKDACGGDRFWQHEGRNKRQAVVRFDILRSNDNDTGEAYAVIESSLFQMNDLSEKGIIIPEFMSDQIDHFNQDLQSSIRQLL